MSYEGYSSRLFNNTFRSYIGPLMGAKMTKLRIIMILVVLMASLVIAYASLPSPEYRIGEDVTNPGRRTYTFYVTDPCGNHEGNRLLVRIDVNGPGPMYAYMTTGLTVWEDPNYWVVDNAVYDPNNNAPYSDEPNDLIGAFELQMNFRHEDYQILIQAFDKATNNSIGEMLIYSRDRGKPRITGFEKEK